MKKEYLKRGFGCMIILTIVVGLILFSPKPFGFGFLSEKDNQLQESETQEEVPLQNAVGEKEIIAKTTNKKKVVKKKVVKKKTTKKVVKKKTIKKSAPKVTGTKAQYQAYAHDLVINKYGWSEYDFQCLVKLWNRESGWSPSAHNKSSGAHGIPQSLPASKMRSAGADYYTNGYTQIRWGLGYIKGRYGSPAKAWAHSQKHHWY